MFSPSSRRVVAWPYSKDSLGGWKILVQRYRGSHIVEEKGGGLAHVQAADFSSYSNRDDARGPSERPRPAGISSG